MPCVATAPGADECNQHEARATQECLMSTVDVPVKIPGNDCNEDSLTAPIMEKRQSAQIAM